MAITLVTLNKKLEDWLLNPEEINTTATRDFLILLGFKIDDIPVESLPVEKMVRNYYEGHPIEDQLTDEGIAKYQQLHPKQKDEYHGVDVFDFRTYFNDFLIFARYYVGLELYLRSAIWISYKYEYLHDQDDRNKLDRELQAKQNKLDYLDTMTDSFEPKVFVEKWYRHFNPSKLTSRPDFLDYIITKPRYLGRPDSLFNQLYHKYVDRDWNTLEDLWFSPDSEDFFFTPVKVKPLSPRIPNKTKDVKPLSPRIPNKTKDVLSHHTAASLQKLTCPQLKDILKQKERYQGCSKLRKDELIAKILE